MNNDNKYYATIATNGNTMCSSFFLSLIILCLTLLISYIARKKKNEITCLIFRMLAHNDIANCFEIIKVRRIYYVNQ